MIATEETQQVGCTRRLMAARDPQRYASKEKILRLANFKEDYWELRNGEKCHQEHPDKFWIPELSDRKSLKRGDAAKLIFDIECEDDDGNITIIGERIYVIVSEMVGDKYIGILDSQPACIDKDQEGVYLRFGAEIPFSSEHVIDINRPPEEYIDWQLGQPPEREWPRD